MLTRKMLSAMELDADKITQIINGHTETVTALQEEIDKARADVNKYKTESEKVPALQQKVAELEKQIETDAKERKGKDYDALKKEFDDYKAEQERKAVHAEKEAAYREILKDAGVPEKHFAKIIKYSDVDGVELDDNGKITTAKDILKSIRDEWSDHIEKTNTKGAETSTPPANAGRKMTVEEIDKITDTAERQKAILENHELFGF